jgi:hypothetical protein
METDDADNNDNAESQESHYKRENLSDMGPLKPRKISVESIDNRQSKNKSDNRIQDKIYHIHRIYSSMFDDIYKSML